MRDLDLELYQKLYLIRAAEEKIRRHYTEDEMKTPMHMSMGEEAITVGVCHALKTEDQVFSTYRSHAVFLAKTEDTNDFFSEMLGKATATVRGRGGSMHLCSPRLGFMGASAIVAAHIPVAVGCAFANKQKKNGRRVVVFFGDGATEEGGFWESLNVACLMKIPVVFVCEDNGLAVHTHTHERKGYKSLNRIVSKFNCHVAVSHSTDVEVIYDLTKEVFKKQDRDSKPCFLELKYYRYLEHVGINYDFDAKYRPENEFKKWKKRDAVCLQRMKLLKRKKINIVARIEKGIDQKIEDSFLKARKSPFIKPCDIYKDVFDEDDDIL